MESYKLIKFKNCPSSSYAPKWNRLEKTFMHENHWELETAEKGEKQRK